MSSSAADPILHGLNPAQLEAVTHRGSPLLVIAGAGSGKTRVVTRRMAHLAAAGEEAKSIFAVTFTNKAAGEMKERVAQLLGAGQPSLWVSTFHSAAARILRREGGGLHRTAGFTIYDQDDGLRLIKSVLDDLNADDKEFQPRAVQAKIDRWKNDAVRPADVKEGFYRERVFAKAYSLYEQRLELANALDFNDLLLETVRLFQERPEVLASYRRRFRHVLVDEYQDTNAVQYEMVKLLAGDGAGLCAVGDPDQSIYGWRGARIDNILSFSRSFPGTRVVRLEQNYRSTAPILSAAGRVIANNQQRIERGLEAVRGGGEPVQLFIGIDEQHEAAEVARRLSEAFSRERKASEFAVFYRTNAQSRAFEEAFLQSAIPYTLVNGTAFYQRAEVKDALAYLRLAVNPKDSVSFARAVNQPPRGLGEGSLRRLEEAARSANVSPMEAAGRPEVRSALSAKAAQGLEDFAAAVASIGGAEAYPVEGAVRTMLSKSGLLARFRDRDEDERVENLDQLAAAAGEYDFANPEGSLAGFLEQVALVADIDAWDEKAERVSLMTLHAAKGLEFNTVFLTGLEDGLLPHSRTGRPEDSDVEEERRIFYVGMTRARDELVLTLARARRRFGPLQPTAASRFVGELPADEVSPAGAVARAVAAPGMPGRYRDDDFDDAPQRRRRVQAAGRAAAAQAPKRAADGERYYDEEALARASAEALDLDVGDIVVHEKFGRGRVEALDGLGDTARITVSFSGYGRKKFVAAYAKLRKA